MLDDIQDDGPPTSEHDLPEARSEEPGAEPLGGPDPEPPAAGPDDEATDVVPADEEPGAAEADPLGWDESPAGSEGGPSLGESPEAIVEPVASEDVEEPVASEDAGEPVAPEDAAESAASEDAGEPVAPEDAGEPVASEDVEEPVASDDGPWAGESPTDMFEPVAPEDAEEPVASDDGPWAGESPTDMFEPVAPEDAGEPVASEDAAEPVASDDGPWAGESPEAAAAPEDAGEPVASEDVGEPVASEDVVDPVASEHAVEPVASDAQHVQPAPTPDEPEKPKKKAASKKSPGKKKAASRPASETQGEPTGTAQAEPAAGAPGEGAVEPPSRRRRRTGEVQDAPPPATMVLFRAPEPVTAAQGQEPPPEPPGPEDADQDDVEQEGEEPAGEGAAEDGAPGPRRRRRRGGRRRRRPGEPGTSEQAGEAEDVPVERPGEPADAEPQTDAEDKAEPEAEPASAGTTRRRRRRRRTSEDGDEAGEDAASPRARTARPEDEITAVSGSTRLEAKKQRRREGREAGRRRAPIVSEAEFLARRESVDRVMVIRQRGGLTQIAVLEDQVLVEHYVARESQTSLIGNVYLGRVQNVLPSMEAAFVDIGKGRNAVLYAGEVNWSALGHPDGQPRKIESVLSSGQAVLVQVTKDPVGHKGARLTSQISLAGRFLVYVPDGTTSGISRKLPDTERGRLKTLLKEIVPESAGVIVRTAAEGASEEELTRDVQRLTERWLDIEGKSKSGAPKLLYSEPDLTLKVVRDLFTEDFGRLVVEGDEAWETVQGYVAHVAPDLGERLERHQPESAGGDVFAAYRIDEQIAKGLDRKVWLPSGGSLIIDRTEAMTVIDVNTGKFTGSGGNLEETVTKNNLEAAEEIVRQLRLRDIGGIIVVDFIDMVLESNRELVLRRLVECLGRDRTRHQVAEVTSLGLVQMTRKRIGTGLLEAFSNTCEHCQGRGVVVHDMPVEPRRVEDEGRRGQRRGRARGASVAAAAPARLPVPSPLDVAAAVRHDNGDHAATVRPGATEEGATARADAAAASEPASGSPAPDADSLVDEQRPGQAPVQQPGQAPVQEPGADVAPARAGAEPAGQRPWAEEHPPQPADAPSSAQDESVPPAGDDRRGEPAGSVREARAPGEEAGTEVEQAAATRVVTRTRRRSASRPAGPPGAVAPMDAVDDDGVHGHGLDGHGDDADGEDADGEDAHSTESMPDRLPVDADAHGIDATPVEHVPIKRKGTRKR